MPAATIVKEETSQYIPHDHLAKELINNFFEELLEVFFPEVHESIDFTAISPLSEEVYTDLLDGENRELDIVIETKLKEEDTVIIVHVEPQSYTEKHFHERMYHYFSLLYNKYRKPILPIAVFTYDENRKELEAFTIEFPFFHVLTFNFLMLELRKKNWRDYIKSDNPAAAGLLSKMGYTEEERVEVKKEFLEMLVRMELNPAKSRFITAFFETYLVLNEEEEEELMEQIKRSDVAEKVYDLYTSWEEKGIEKGRKEGRKEGKKEGKFEEKRSTSISMLKEGLSIELIARVTGLDKEEIENISRNL